MSVAPMEAVTVQTKLVKLIRRQLERFATRVPKALISDHPETVHDLRVASRRLQQLLRVVAPFTAGKSLKKVTHVLRTIRQALGPCRDFDVNIALIEAMCEQSATGSVQRAWQCLTEDLVPQRQALLARGRHEIASQDLFKLIDRVQRRLDLHDTEPLEQITKTIAQSMEAWRQAFAAAHDDPDVAALHNLRIAGKKLRYRAEILADLGQASVKPLVKSLRDLQTALGDWHDRTLLRHHVANFIARPDFLAEQPDTARVLLAEMEKEKMRSATEVASILQLADKVSEAWTRGQMREA